MLSALKFVKGSVAKSSADLALTHFVIENKTMRGFNGVFALCSPVPLDFACKPKADTFIAAIGKCEATTQLTLTAKGRLSVKSGAFKALVPCIEESTSHVQPEGERVDFDGKVLLEAFRLLSPFMGTDTRTDRMWSNGILLRGQSAFATNNACLVESWIGAVFPFTVNVPRETIREMLRINEVPTYAQMVEGNSVTFHYEGARWLRTQLRPCDWPDLSSVLDVESIQSELPETFFPALTSMKPFLGELGSVFFKNGGITTSDSDDDGASYEVLGLHQDGRYNLEMLMLLKDVAKTADFTRYPKPVIFMNNSLRGALMGVRK